MYAIIRTGGKQYKVQAGDVLQVDKLEQALGAEFEINEVLMVGGDTATLGQPLVKGATVTAVVTKQAKTRKLIVFKKKRRQGYRKLNTHKQEFTEIFVKAITSPDGKVAKKAAKKVAKKKVAKKAVKKTVKKANKTGAKKKAAKKTSKKA